MESLNYSKMNNKGQTIFFTLGLGVLVLVVALAFAPALRQFVTDARGPTTDTQVGLDCTNSSISDFDKSTCSVVDLSLPYFIIGLIGIGLTLITAKLLTEGQ